MRRLLTVLMCVFAAPAFAQNGQNEWIEMAAHDLQQSQLTLPGGTPFHLRAEIVETTDPTSKYHGNVEEYWVTPEKWKRIVQSPEFSQTITVNSDKIREKNSGDYFPWWLNNALTAIFTPLPGVVVSSPAGPYAGKSLDTKISSVCTNTQTTTDRWSFCFDPHRNLLTSVLNLSTDYGAEFKDFAQFGKKQVPRRIVFNPDNAITIEVKITELEKLQQPDEQPSVAPQQREVIVVGVVQMKRAAEAAFGMLQRDDIVHQRVELRKRHAEGCRGCGQRADPDTEVAQNHAAQHVE